MAGAVRQHVELDVARAGAAAPRCRWWAAPWSGCLPAKTTRPDAVAGALLHEVCRPPPSPTASRLRGWKSSARHRARDVERDHDVDALRRHVLARRALLRARLRDHRHRPRAQRRQRHRAGGAAARARPGLVIRAARPGNASAPRAAPLAQPGCRQHEQRRPAGPTARADPGSWQASRATSRHLLLAVPQPLLEPAHQRATAASRWRLRFLGQRPLPARELHAVGRSGQLAHRAARTAPRRRGRAGTRPSRPRSSRGRALPGGASR